MEPPVESSLSHSCTEVSSTRINFNKQQRPPDPLYSIEMQPMWLFPTARLWLSPMVLSSPAEVISPQ